MDRRPALAGDGALPFYNSEWNAQSTDWRTGLYAGGLLNAYERQGKKFTLGGPALFLRHLSAGAWDNAFINFDHTGWFAAPGSLRARNTLREPTTVRAELRAVQLDGQRVRFELPPFSTAVSRLN
jgi:hypothetical protein